MLRTIESEQLTTADLANVAQGREREEPHSEESHREEPRAEPLLTPDSSADMRTRWEAIQTGFVDDPRVSVQRADELVAAAIARLAESFAQERANLERQWSQGNDVSTEELRQALRRYRAFFQRLLAV
jgi:hypothetical protein